MKSEAEILELVKKRGWGQTIINEQLSEDILRKYSNEFDKDCWSLISQYKNLSEQFIEEFEDKLNWWWIFWDRKLSEKFIVKYQKKLNKDCWEIISQRQKLSENIIRKNIKYLNEKCWEYISKYQNLSESFIEEFKDKLNLTFVYLNQKLSSKFILKYKNEIGYSWEELILQNKNILEKTIIELWNYFDLYFKNKYLSKLNKVEKLIFLSKVKKEKQNEKRS